MINTPRTDAHILPNHKTAGGHDVVHADFCRTIERELIGRDLDAIAWKAEYDKSERRYKGALAAGRTALAMHDDWVKAAASKAVHCGTFDHEGRCGACAKKLSELKKCTESCPLGLYPQWPWPEEDTPLSGAMLDAKRYRYLCDQNSDSFAMICDDACEIGMDAAIDHAMKREEKDMPFSGSIEHKV